MMHVNARLLIGIVASRIALGNSCPPSPDPSEEFARSDAVFLGEVIAVEMDVRGHSPEERFDRFRFQVVEVWKGRVNGIVELWEESSGYDLRFVKGQTLLIYADRTANGKLSSGRCRRGGALHESGADLAFLHFVKHKPQRSSRLFGFVTTNEDDLAAWPRNWKDPPHPAWDVTIRVDGPDGPRYTMIDVRGGFVIDGLAGGEYVMTIYGPDYPLRKRIVKQGIKVIVRPRGFARQEVFVSKDSLREP